MVGMMSRTHSHEGEEVAVFGAEIDEAGKILKGGEINYKKSATEENVESKGTEDPRVILKSCDLPIPREVKSLNFQVTGELPDSIDKFKS